MGATPETRPIRDVPSEAQADLPQSASSTSGDVTGRNRLEATLRANGRVLEMLAGGAPLDAVLMEICRAAEQQLQGSACSILLFRPETGKLHLGAAPNVPEWFQTLAGEGIPVHPAVERRDITLSAGLHACWMRFLCGDSGQLLGAFAVCYTEPRSLSDADTLALSNWLHLASLAVSRLQSQQALRKNEEQFRTLLANTPDVISRFDGNLRFLYISPAVERNTGIRPEAFLGKTHAEAGIAPVLSARLESVLKEIFETGQRRSVEFELPGPDGQQRHYHGVGVPEASPDGRVQTVLTIVRDISDVTRAAEAVSTTEERQRLAVDAGNIGLWDWDIATNKVVWTERVYEFHGLSRDAFGGTVEEFGALVHVEDFGRVSEALARALKHDEPYEMEFRAVRPTGEERWLSTRARVVRDNMNRPVRMLGAVLDITERKRAEAERERLHQALRESEDHYRSTVEINPQVPWTATAEGQIDDVSPQWLTLTGLTREQALRVGWVDVPHPDDLPRMLEGWEHSMRSGEPFDMEHRIRVADGSHRWMRTRARPRRNSEGKVVRWYGTTEDINDRRSFEEQLRHSEERYRFLAEALPQFVWVADAHGLTEYLNDYWYSYTGTSRERPLSETWPTVAHPDDQKSIVDAWQQASENGKEFSAEYRIKRASDGVYHWHLSRYRPIRDEHGAITRWLGTAIDIHDRREAEAALRQSEERFRRIVETASEGIWILDPESRTTFVNQRMGDLLGYEPNEMLGRSCFDFIHPEDVRRGQEGFELRKQGDVSPREYRAFRKDGSTRWLEFTAGPMRGPNGGITGVLGMCTDITERRAAQQALLESEERYRSVTNATTAIVWMTDAEGAFLVPQLSWERYTGQPWAEHKGFGWAGMIHPEDRDALIADWMQAKEAGAHYGSQGRIWHAATAQFRHTTVKAIAIKNADGSIREWTGVIEDVHERRLAEDALKESNEALRRANAALEQFAYAAAHDLQEPVRNVALYTQLLARNYQGRFDAQADDFLKITVEGARRMQNLIQDLLSYTRATDETGVVEPDTDAAAVMEQVVQNLRTAIELSQAEIFYEVLPRVGVREGQLVQLLQNLVSNALKYHGQETPRVHVSAEPEGRDWLFTVRDNGQGIPAEHRERIFKVFKRLHGREIPGTGIGLAICERIVTHYGGRLWVESEEGHGAAFHFTLPGAGRQD